MIVDNYTHIFPPTAYKKMTEMPDELGKIGKRVARLMKMSVD